MKTRTKASTAEAEHDAYTCSISPLTFSGWHNFTSSCWEEGQRAGGRVPAPQHVLFTLKTRRAGLELMMCIWAFCRRQTKHSAITNNIWDWTQENNLQRVCKVSLMTVGRRKTSSAFVKHSRRGTQHRLVSMLGLCQLSNKNASYIYMILKTMSHCESKTRLLKYTQTSEYN